MKRISKKITVLATLMVIVTCANAQIYWDELLEVAGVPQLDSFILMTNTSGTFDTIHWSDLAIGGGGSGGNDESVTNEGLMSWTDGTTTYTYNSNTTGSAPLIFTNALNNLSSTYNKSGNGIGITLSRSAINYWDETGANPDVQYNGGSAILKNNSLLESHFFEIHDLNTAVTSGGTMGGVRWWKTDGTDATTASITAEYNGTAGNTNLLINGSSRVDITAPATRVSSLSGNGLVYSFGGNGTLGNVTIGSGLTFSGGTLSASGATSPWTVGTQGRIYRNAGGSLPNVGINNSSPTHPLHVTGSIRIQNGTFIDNDNSGGQDHQFLSEDPADDRTDWRYVQPNFAVNTSTGVVTATMTSSATTNSGSFTIPSTSTNFGQSDLAGITLTGTTNETGTLTSSLDNGNVNVNTGLDRIELTESGFYRFVVNGIVAKTSGSNRTITCYLETNGVDSTIDNFALTHEEQTSFSINKIVNITSTNANVQIEFDLSGPSVGVLSGLTWYMEKL